jgi:hypothetical protein
MPDIAMRTDFPPTYDELVARVNELEVRLNDVASLLGFPSVSNADERRNAYAKCDKSTNCARISSDRLLRILRARCVTAGGIAAWCREHGGNARMMSAALNESQPLAPSVAAWLGYRKVIMWEPIPAGEQARKTTED